MNFLVVAPLPRRMTAWLAAAGRHAIHTLDLPDANRTFLFGGNTDPPHPGKPLDSPVGFSLTMPSPEFIWSFISRIDRVEPGREIEASFLFAPELLAQLGAPRDQEFVPEGLLLECCAQASGFILLAEPGNLDFVPVLARVSEAEFFLPLRVGQEAHAHCKETHRTENGAEFECAVHEAETSQKVAITRLMLGFSPLDKVPDEGQGIRAHLDRLKRQLQLA